MSYFTHVTLYTNVHTLLCNSLLLLEPETPLPTQPVTREPIDRKLGYSSFMSLNVYLRYDYQPSPYSVRV